MCNLSFIVASGKYQGTSSKNNQRGLSGIVLEIDLLLAMKVLEKERDSPETAVENFRCGRPSPGVMGCVLCFSVSPTNLSQFNLPGPSMMRSNSIPAQDSSFDLYDDAQLCGSATSLEERPRAISHSGSFRDSMEEGRHGGNAVQKKKNCTGETIAVIRKKRKLLSLTKTRKPSHHSCHEPSPGSKETNRILIWGALELEGFLGCVTVHFFMHSEICHQLFRIILGYRTVQNKSGVLVQKSVNI